MRNTHADAYSNAHGHADRNSHCNSTSDADSDAKWHTYSYRPASAESRA
jgi:hypothetical protein